MSTSVYMPYHGIRLCHRENITVAPKPMRLRFDKHVLARDGECPPVRWSDFSLDWLEDWARDGWEVIVRNPLRELMERGLLLMTGARIGNPLPGLLGLNKSALPGLIGPAPVGDPWSNPASPFYTLTTYNTAVTPTYTIANNYRFLQQILVGGGAGGQTGSGGNGGGGGGGGGCLRKASLLSPSGNGSLSLSIGAGGAANNNGSDSTSTGAILPLTLTASGGLTGVNPTGGAGGTGTNGDANRTGGNGATGQNGPNAGGGGGGAGPDGDGGNGATNGLAGGAGTVNGGGGGAGSQNNRGAGGGGGQGRRGGNTDDGATFRAGGAAGADGGLVTPATEGANAVSVNPGQNGGNGGGGGGGGTNGSVGGAGGIGAGLILVTA